MNSTRSEVIVDVNDRAGRRVVVTRITYRHPDDIEYQVFVDGKNKHGECNAEEVMRVLATYLHTET